MRFFPTYIQLDSIDCGPTCLHIICSFYGKNYSLKNLRERCHISREVSHCLESEAFRGGISHRKSKFLVHVSDPLQGLLTYTEENF
jgi:ABC-type bacteriocin/lantibiotic exporters, contain an N-terminal double-glycine peptidase domain